MIKRKIKEYMIIFSSFSLMPCFCHIKHFFVEAKQSPYIENIHNEILFDKKIDLTKFRDILKDKNFNNSFKSCSSKYSEYIVKVKIKDKKDKKDKIIEMPFWKYLVGVIFAECSPTVFHRQAVIANIIAAASYAIAKRGLNGIFIADNRVFQSFMPPEEYEKKFPRKTIENLKNLCKVCSNYLLVYKKGESYIPVEALYHTVSSGITQSSEDVWGNKYPYLVSKKSKIEEFYKLCNKKDYIDNLKGLINNKKEKNKLSGFIKLFGENYEQKVEKNLVDAYNEVKKYVEKNNIKANLIDPKDEKYTGKKYIEIKEIVEKTKHVKTVNAFGAILKAIDLERIFGLRSSCFKVGYSPKDNKLKFIVKGAGHCVGMDQIGANILALEGYNYKQILKHFYDQNCDIVEISKVKPEFIFKKI